MPLSCLLIQLLSAVISWDKFKGLSWLCFCWVTRVIQNGGEIRKTIEFTVNALKILKEPSPLNEVSYETYEFKMKIYELL